MSEASELSYLEQLRGTYIRRLHILETKAARFGSNFPAHETMELEDVRLEIKMIDSRIERLKSHTSMVSESVINHSIGLDIGVWTTNEIVSDYGVTSGIISKGKFTWNIVPKKHNCVFTEYPSLPFLKNFDLQCTYSTPKDFQEMAFGVLFRRAFEDYIAFAINIQYRDCMLTKWINKGNTFDDVMPWRHNNNIKIDSTNTLRVIAMESKIRLFINNKLAASITDSNPQPGTTGLFLETFRRNEPIALEITEYRLTELE
jgi:hypothetical protein